MDGGNAAEVLKLGIGTKLEVRGDDVTQDQSLWPEPVAKLKPVPKPKAEYPKSTTEQSAGGLETNDDAGIVS
jgi:hypothetical protein